MVRGLYECYGIIRHCAGHRSTPILTWDGWVVGGIVRPLVIRQGSANPSRTTIRTVRSACVLHMSIVYDSPVNIVLARQASPIRSITNAECKLAMCACINTHKHIHTWIHTHIHTHTWTHIYIHTYINIYIYIHTYTFTWHGKIDFFWRDYRPRTKPCARGR